MQLGWIEEKKKQRCAFFWKLMLGLHATLQFFMHFCACIQCVSTVCYAFTVIGRIQAVIWYDFWLLRYRYWFALCKISRYTRRIYLNKKKINNNSMYSYCVVVFSVWQCIPLPSQSRCYNCNSVLLIQL